MVFSHMGVCYTPLYSDRTHSAIDKRQECWVHTRSDERMRGQAPERGLTTKVEAGVDGGCKGMLLCCLLSNRRCVVWSGNGRVMRWMTRDTT